MAIFKKREKPTRGNPDKSAGKKSRLTIFLGIVVILAGGAYVYMNYLGPKLSPPPPKKRVVKKRVKRKAKKPRAVAKKAVKARPKRQLVAKKQKVRMVKAKRDLESRVRLLEDRLIDRPTYEELLARIKRLEYSVQSLGGQGMRTARVAPASAAAVSTRKLPREYRRLRSVFRTVESDRYPKALFDKMRETAPGTVSFTLPELMEVGVEQVSVTSVKGKREVTVVTDKESKITNRVLWSSGIWAYTRKDSKDLLNGVGLRSVPVEEFLKAEQTYRKAIDILYKALSG